MRIKRIHMENFGSFELAAVDLSTIESATIFGANGHGKSTAFVDAPLWALFGKCRTDTDAMIRLNCDRMLVELTFSLDGQTYRVIRTRSKATKAGKTELAFEVFSDSLVIWQPIGGSKIAETQEAICSVLNADFNLCTSTNFVIQGQADKFSKATPAERKVILSQILRLDQYAILKSAANSRLIAVTVTLGILDQEVRELKETADKLLPSKGKIKEASSELETQASLLIQCEKAIHAHIEARAKKVVEVNESEGARLEQSRLAKEGSVVVATMVRVEEDLDRANGILEKREEIQGKAHGMTLNDRMIVDLEKTLTIQEKEQEELNDKMLVLIKQQDKETKTLARVELELERLNTKKQSSIDVHKQAVRLRGEDVARDQTAVDSLSNVPCWKELQEKCPYTIEAVAIEEALPDKKADLADLMVIDPVPIELPTYDADMKHRLEQIENLKHSPIGCDVEQELGKLQAVVEKTKHSRQARAKLLEIRNTLKPYAELKPELEAADREIERLLHHKAENSGWLSGIQTAQAKNRALLESLPGVQEWLQLADETEKSLRRDNFDITGAIDRLKESLIEARHEEARAQAAADKIVLVNQDIKDQGAKAEAMSALSSAYTTIPIFLMEQAVPMLEHVTNRILEQISPSGMKVRLETQRTLKSRDALAETLDILVRDTHGERPYENYSGGERFRLDLAIRLGLAELLITRAGSRLETLVIDEGLGSLDAEGLDLLRECLTKLEKTFGLILVISHVDAIQGTFPTSICVTKGAHGSTFEVFD